MAEAEIRYIEVGVNSKMTCNFNKMFNKAQIIYTVYTYILYIYIYIYIFYILSSNTCSVISPRKKQNVW